MTDSSTGGFLQPADAPESLEEIENIIHDLIAGITGLPGCMVRAMWQRKAALYPEQGIDWCAFAISEEGGNLAGGEIHFGEGEGHNIVAAHEPFSVLTVFYGDNSRIYAQKLRRGLSVAQNREYLYRRDIAFVEAGAAVHVPEVTGEEWIDRWDVKLSFRRREAGKYPVLNIKKFNVPIHAGIGRTIKSRKG